MIGPPFLTGYSIWVAPDRSSVIDMNLLLVENAGSVNMEFHSEVLFWLDVLLSEGHPELWSEKETTLLIDESARAMSMPVECWELTPSS